ncbi:MAG: 4-alpha-glucanotransferase [Bacteroidota bacterium]
MIFPRGSGILLHPTSLPGPYGSGDLGPAAYHFVDWMVVAGQSLWQMLPLGPVGLGNSPYMSLSAFAGSSHLIDLQELAGRGLLTQQDLASVPAFSSNRVDYAKVIPFRLECLRKASERFFAAAGVADRKDFDSYCASASLWLEDYALFGALHEKYQGKLWTEWDGDLVRRKPLALRKAAKDFAPAVRFQKFVQWCFARQWKNLKRYANERGIKIIGDIPIFLSHQSADVWANPEQYILDAKGNPTVVAGVPPDYFSKTGQRWGNPLYRWNVMKADRYRWWVERVRRSLELFDIVRIDHFRGFVAHWEIPAVEKTAVKGKWVKGPGPALFTTLVKTFKEIPIIAEDLGLITPEVVALRDQFQYPGMKVLHFAFTDGPENVMLPHHFKSNCVVYTGTHDNDTTRGWFNTAPEHEKNFFRWYGKSDGNEVHWDLIRLASQSIADMAVVPFQDVLGLGIEGRMNYPGRPVGNWDWRFSWDAVQRHHALRLYELTALYGRCKPDRLKIPS